MTEKAKYQKEFMLRSVIRTYNIRTPVEKMKEQSVLWDGSIKISPKDVSEHMNTGAKDTVCIFYLQDGSLLVMEKGLAKERLKDEYGEMLGYEKDKD